MSRQLFGRTVIYTDEEKITSDNLISVLTKAISVHESNSNDIQYLYDYYKGKTPILEKTKEVRESINHKVNENRAYEIVSFHKGYTFGEAIQYVRRENSANNTDDDAIATDINALNGYMSDADKVRKVTEFVSNLHPYDKDTEKAACDNDIAEWIYVGGAGYRLTLPNAAWQPDADEPPFKVYSLDARQTFIVRNNGVDRRPLMAVYCVERENHERVYSGYTDKFYFEISEFNGLTAWKPHTLGMIPIVEYPADIVCILLLSIIFKTI